MKRILLFTSLFVSIIATAQNVGIGTNDPKTKLDINGGLSLREGPVLTLVNGGAQGSANDNIVLPDVSGAAGVKAGFYRIAGPTAAFSVFGIVPTTNADGQMVTLVNTTSQVMTIKNNSSSTAANGFKTLTNSDMISVAGNSSISIQYNKTDSRWYVTASQNYTLPGAMGPTGPTGTAGATGLNGADGPTGAAGAAGAAGPTGAQGAAGAAGPGYLASSVSSVTIGTGSQVFATQAGLAYLPGDRVRVSNSSTNYVEGIVTAYASNNLTVNVDLAVGSGTYSAWNIGIAGNVGSAGAQGAAGAAGPTGAQGVQGVAGAQGSAGVTGAQGVAGAAGPTGAQGVQGVAGPTGTAGSAGAQGPQGVQGITGPTGTPGASGLLAPGTAAGNTTYWNGTTWVLNSSTIYNNGGNVGIGTTSPAAPFNTYATPTSGFVEQIRVGGTSNYPSLQFGTYGAYDGYIGTFGNDLRLLAGKGVASENHAIHFFTGFNGAGGAAENNERMTINYNGNVGIGRTDPQQKLNVYSSGTAMVLVQSSDPATYSGFRTSWNDGTSSMFQMLYHPNSAQSFIETSYNPTSGAPYGDIAFRSDVTGTPRELLRLHNYTRNVTMATGGGNVGIGTATPATLLDVNGTARAITLQLTNANTALTQGSAGALRITTPSGYGDIGAQNGGYFHFQTSLPQYYFDHQTVINGNHIPYTDNTNDLGSSTNRWRNLYVGGAIVGPGAGQFIQNGTASQTADFNITGNGIAAGSFQTPNLYVSNYRHTAGTYEHVYSDNNSSGGFDLLRNDGNRWGYFYADNGGIGILHGGGGWAIRSTNGIGAANTDISFYTNSAQQAIITSTGMGIGTTSPTQKLTVAGNINKAGSWIVGDAVWGANNFEIHDASWNGSANGNYGGLVGGHAYMYGGLQSGGPSGNEAASGQLYVAGKSMLMGDVGIKTTAPTEALSINGATVTNPAAGETFISGGAFTSSNFQVKRDFATWNCTNSSSNPVHIKTNIPYQSSLMYRILVEGYNYGVSQPINSEAVGYTYSGVNYIYNEGNVNHATGAAISQYYSTDGFVVIKLSAATFYYAGFSVSAWLTNPAGNGFNIKATAILQQAGNLYCNYTPGSQTFNYTGGAQSWTVPCGVTSITVDARGASGGNGTSGTGGNGGRIQTTIAVTPGGVIDFYVGGAGASYSNGGGYNGGGSGSGQYCCSVGGGGGGSDVRIGGTRVVVAGGGGGAAYNGCGEPGAAGGGTTGAAAPAGCGTYGGQGGTQSGGGIGGAYSGYATGGTGSAGQGGNAGGGTGGGGGGGGYYGGGGGSWNGDGGGSSYSNGSGTTHTQGYQSGNGSITISW